MKRYFLFFFFFFFFFLFLFIFHFSDKAKRHKTNQNLDSGIVGTYHFVEMNGDGLFLFFFFIFFFATHLAIHYFIISEPPISMFQTQIIVMDYKILFTMAQNHLTKILSQVF